MLHVKQLHRIKAVLLGHALVGQTGKMNYRVINLSRQHYGICFTSSFSTAPIDSGMDFDQCRDQALYTRLTTLGYFHLQNISLKTPNVRIYFEKSFGFQYDFWYLDQGIWLVIDGSMVLLLTLILAKKSSYGS